MALVKIHSSKLGLKLIKVIITSVCTLLHLAHRDKGLVGQGGQTGNTNTSASHFKRNKKRSRARVTIGGQ